MTKEEKNTIDNMSYIELLQMWRHGTSDNLLFHRETGKYFRKIMMEKKYNLDHRDQVDISKIVGW